MHFFDISSSKHVMLFVGIQIALNHKTKSKTLKPNPQNNTFTSPTKKTKLRLPAPRLLFPSIEGSKRVAMCSEFVT